jgi:MinD superfamily P-loop ATPase
MADMTRIKTIAIASGKGGTGKTTVAVNLAYTASRLNEKVQYLDCDVEEPNGQFFLKPQISSARQVCVEVPEVDKDKCTGCGKCGVICQFGAIVCLGGKNVLTFEQLCHSCGGCMRICPADAIRPRRLEIGRIETGNCGEIEFISGTLKIGHVRTPSMVKEVKKSIRPDAFSIIDTAPGTSCAVVETLKGADYVLLVTEPTPFGLNDLKLAVDLVRKMNLPFAVVINRYGIGNEDAERYCQAEGIEIALKLPDDRRIAEMCSTGRIIVDALGEYGQQFSELYEYINAVKTRTYD